MQCVRCAACTRVVRTLQRAGDTHRIRVCASCGHVFRTWERLMSPREERTRRERYRGEQRG